MVEKKYHKIKKIIIQNLPQAMILISFGLLSTVLYKELKNTNDTAPFQTSIKSKWYFFFNPLYTYYKNYEEKIKHYAEIDQENKSLKEKIESFTLLIEILKSQNLSGKACMETFAQGALQKFKGGSSLALLPDQLNPSITQGLPLNYKIIAGLNLFSQQQYEKSLAVFLEALQTDGVVDFHVHEIYIYTSICWFHLENYVQSDIYLKKVIEAQKDINPSLKATAILWQALIAEKTSDIERKNFLLKELIAKYPTSLEVEWIQKKTYEKKEIQNI